MEKKTCRLSTKERDRESVRERVCRISRGIKKTKDREELSDVKEKPLKASSRLKDNQREKLAREEGDDRQIKEAK